MRAGPTAGGRELTGTGGGSRPREWVHIALLLALVLGSRVIDLGHPPDVDEFHHILAGRSLLAEGTLRIPGGEVYDRSWVFTYLVAGFFRVFGESLVVARIPALLAGAGLIVALFVWVHSVAGRTAAWGSAVLFLFYPPAIFYSQVSRFYTLQALLFFGGAVAAHRLLSPPLPAARQAFGIGIAGAAALALALHLQVITAVGIAGLAVWVAGVAGLFLVRRSIPVRMWCWILAAAAVLAVLLAFFAVRTGIAAQALELFRYADYWAAGERDNVRFYHWRLLDHFGTLWTLFPLALVLALAAAPRAASLCGVVFAVAFLFHSLAAWKHERYLFYAMPMFFAVSGMAVAAVVPIVRKRVEALLARLIRATPPARLTTACTTGVLSAIALFAAAGNGAFSTTLHMLAPSDFAEGSRRPFRGQANWGAAVAELRPIADSSAVIVSSSNLKALYYLGRMDFDIEAQRLYTSSGWLPEFTVFPHTGRPAISAPESLRRVIECYASGLVVTEHGQWRRPWGVLPATADYLLQHTETVFISEPWQLMAFRWRRPAVTPKADCPPAGTTGEQTQLGAAGE